MRIALAHSQLNTFGGGERAVLELARGLAPRHDVRLLVGDFAPDRTYGELARFPHVRLKPSQWLGTWHTDEVIISNSFGANLLALRNGARVIYWVHSLRSQFLLPGVRRPDLLLRRTLDRLAVRRAARLLANSRFTASRMCSLYGRAVDAVVYPGVDLELFRPMPGDKTYAMTVGRLAKEKGVDRLFDLWCDFPGSSLHVVGDGSPEFVQQLRARAPPQVVFRGALSPAEVAAAYQQAAVAVFAPRAEEFGIAPLEATACGVPVVAWREGGLVETVIDSQTGYLVSDTASFKRCVRLLIDDPALRHRLGQAARRRAEEFSWKQTIAQIEQQCVDLVNTR